MSHSGEQGHRWQRALSKRGVRLLLLAIGLSVLALLIGLGTAAAQTDRGTELIGRAMAADPDERKGAMLYERLCASCHGAKALGTAAPVTPALAGQLNVYLIKQLVDFSEGDRNEAEMHRVTARKEISTPQAIRDLATYLSNLPPNTRPEQGDGAGLADAERLYEALCSLCHGQQGEGNEKHATPALRGQHYSYLLMQSRRLALGHRYSVPIEVIEVLEKLPFDRLTSVADYASRLSHRSSDSPAATSDREQPATNVQ